MVETTAQQTAPPAPAASRGLLARAVGIVVGPRATYADVAAHPRALGILLLVILTSSVLIGGFMSTGIGREVLIDQQLTMMESFGVRLNDVQMQAMESRMQYAVYYSVGGQFAFFPLAALAFSGVAFAIFNALLGGDATFKQVFAVVSHSGVIAALQSIFSVPIFYFKESMANPTSLAIFLPMLDEATFFARLLGSIDLFRIWWLMSLAIGLAVLYRRKTAPIAIGLLAVYIAIALVIAGVMTAFSGA